MILVMRTTVNSPIVDGAAIITAATVDSVEADQKNRKGEHSVKGVLGTMVGLVRLQQRETTVIRENVMMPVLYCRHLLWI